ncbi:hypothetical protein NTGHW29_650067 [Candidatus Nitrotoga sp. HW29]|nr:hypothetical protein NTGHW29_650067 [Candidatus Nitrotoga sp. HW29]
MFKHCDYFLILTCDDSKVLLRYLTSYALTIAHILSLVGRAFKLSTFKPECSTIKRNVLGVK